MSNIVTNKSHNLLLEGCGFYPNICTYGNEIEVLEEEIYPLVDDLRTSFEGNSDNVTI